MFSEHPLNVVDVEPDTFLPEGRAVRANNSLLWWARAWRFFLDAPGTWLLMGLTFLAICIFLNASIFLSLLVLPFSMLCTGGVVLGCDALHRGGRLHWAHLFAGCQQKFSSLICLGLVILGLSALAIGAAILPFALSSLPLFFAKSTTWSDLIAVMGYFVLWLGLATVLLLPVVMAAWFSAALVVKNNYGVGRALVVSLKACAKNWRTFSLHALLLFVFGLAASIPLGLGFLVLLPVLSISVYTSYRDVFYQSTL